MSEWDHYFRDEREFHERFRGLRCNRSNWQGPGWYHIKEYQQPCPRGCCQDDVVETSTFAERVEELREEIREKARDLVFVKARLRERLDRQT